MSNFEKPALSGTEIEVRLDKSGVAIYGSKSGLVELARLCNKLVESVATHESQHFHIEDFNLLTKDSKLLTLVCFNEK